MKTRTRLLKFEYFCAAAIFILFFGRPGCSGENSHTKLDGLFKDAWEFRLTENPLFATSVGDHRYNDRLPSVTIQDRERRVEKTREYLGRLHRVDRDVLSPEDKISYDIFEHLALDEIAEFEHKAYLIPITNRSGFHVSFAELPNRIPLEAVRDYENYIARLQSFDSYTQQYISIMREGIKSGFVLARIVLEGYEASIESHIVGDITKSVYYKPFDSFPSTVSDADRDRFRESGKQAIFQHVIPGYESFLNFMANEYVPACRQTISASDLPGGKSYYEYLVRHHTTLDLSPEEIHEIGMKEVNRIREEMEGIIAKVKFRGDFKKFVYSLRTDPKFYAKTPEALLDRASSICKRMDGELPRLFETLPRLPYGIKRVPEYIAPKTTGAYYQAPTGDGTRAGFYFLNTYDLNSRPLYVLEALSFHEAVPGHHLQIALQQEMKDVPQFRRFAGLTAFVEGWALYSERLGLEVGFYTDPYSDFGRLTYEMWRACRLVVDTGMHSLGWSRQKAIDFMADHTALSLHEITTEVDRYISWPGQALAYKMGELKIRELRDRAQISLGEKFDVREFHAVVLENGSLPLDILEHQVNAFISSQLGIE
jgi:uncharacterized protein (DUF885 family)